MHILPAQILIEGAKVNLLKNLQISKMQRRGIIQNVAIVSFWQEIMTNVYMKIRCWKIHCDKKLCFFKLLIIFTMTGLVGIVSAV
jgi:hypothetical protein